MEQRQMTPVAMAGCFVAVIVVLSFLSRFLPFFSFAAFFIMPVPLIIMYVRYGFRQALLTGVAAAILTSICIDPIQAVMQFLVFGAAGLAIGAGFQRAWPPVRMLLGVTAAFIFAFIALIGIMYVTMDVNIFQSIDEAFKLYTETSMATYRAQGMSLEEMAKLQSQYAELQELLPSLIPLIACLSSAIVAYANIKASQVILRRLGIDVPPFLPIRYWEISRIMVYLYVLALVMKYWGTTRQIDWLNLIGLNLSQMAFFFISIQGIAFIFYLLYRRHHVSNLVQAMIIIGMFVIPIFTYAAFLLGLYDMLFNYRKKHDL